MVDIKLVRQNPDLYKQAAKDKSVSVDIDKLLLVDKSRSEAMEKIESLQAQRNVLDSKIKTSSDGERSKLLEKAKELKRGLAQLEPELKKIQKDYNYLLSRVPLLPAKDVPVGKEEEDNEVLSVKGTKPEFDFEPKDHIELGQDLDILDLESGVNISGFRGYILKNEGVLLQFAVLWYTIKKLQEKGFTLIIPPILVKSMALFGSGHFPFDTENIYRVVEQEHLDKDKKIEPLYLAGTSEPSLLAMYAKKTLKQEDLPLKLCGFSPCYRSEIGSYGKDTKGLYRVHEFWKVEQVVICENSIELSDEYLEDLRSISEEVLTDLELPYRVVKNCTGDMGAGKYRMYDLETWMPSRNKYGETHSDSALHDWQARRLNIKYKDSDGKKKYAYTLNNTGIASPRILIPLLENHQQADGSVKVPEVLQPYVGKDFIMSK